VTRVGEPVAAFAFLTRVPLGPLARHDRDSVGAAAPFFPVAGAAIVLGAGAVAQTTATFAPALLAAALAVSSLALVTGALHLDALADTADALGGWSREDRLRIMRDHPIGAYGATALFLTLLIEVAAFAALLEADASLAVFVAVGAASRAVAPPLAAILPYARLDEAATSVTSGFTSTRAGVALAVAAALAVVAGVDGLLVLASSLGVAAAVGLFCRRWLGGVTGDTLGAATQVAEVAGLIVAVAVT
jgi:adenosylcobinamide-GDP ribazoletransferase